MAFFLSVDTHHFPDGILPDNTYRYECNPAIDRSCPPDIGVHAAGLRYYLVFYNRSFLKPETTRRDILANTSFFSRLRIHAFNNAIDQFVL